MGQTRHLRLQASQQTLRNSLNSFCLPSNFQFFSWYFHYNSWPLWLDSPETSSRQVSVSMLPRCSRGGRAPRWPLCAGGCLRADAGPLSSSLHEARWTLLCTWAGGRNSDCCCSNYLCILWRLLGTGRRWENELRLLFGWAWAYLRWL